MTKRERLEDLGIIYAKLDAMLQEEIFEHLESKHSYESWVKVNHDKIEYDEPRGLYHIHSTLRHVVERLHELCYLARGDIE
jgi:hypothetical protein